MVKGFNRRVIVMKNTDSDFFDEAYFIVKENCNMKKKRGERPLDEAKRIIRDIQREKTPPSPASVFMRNTAFFLLGLLVGGAICIIL